MMKIKKSTLIILTTVGAMFLVGIVIVSLSYNSIRKQLLNENQEYIVEKTNSLSLLLRYYIISGNLHSAYNYIDEIAQSSSISYFGIVTSHDVSDGNLSGQYNVRSPDATVIRELENSSVFRDLKDKILFTKSSVYFDEIKNIPAATIYFGFYYGKLTYQLEKLRINFLFFIMVMTGCFILAIVFAVKLNHQNYGLLLNYFFNISQHHDSVIPKSLLDYEVVIHKAQDMAGQLNRMKNMEKDAAVGIVALQVAHDIRSPLAALSAVTHDLSELPEEKRIMIRGAVQRISDIANDLAYRGDKNKMNDDHKIDNDQVSLELLSGIIDSLISEKRLQHRSRLGISIQSNLNEKSYGLFAKVQPSQFKRVISNLINNAVEAIVERGTVTVAMLTNKLDDIVVRVTDTGSGISPENLARLMQRGVTIGKKDGQGLGLMHARESVEVWGGEIEITSEVGKGTTVTVTLPRQIEPDWFIPELSVYQKMHVAILDDDESIHQIWRGRFESAGVAVFMSHFANGEQLKSWLAKEGPVSGPLLILCDYEIIGSTTTGLDVIKELKLADHTVLVTSRFEEGYVRQECARLGIRLLPKNLAAFVPIKLKEIPDNIEYVLIDDSRLNRATWEIMARRKQRKVLTFEKPRDFFDVAEKINKDAKFYVDLNLGAGLSGKDVTREIHAKGFQEIYLYTGESRVDTTLMPWLAGVAGKTLPFD